MPAFLPYCYVLNIPTLSVMHILHLVGCSGKSLRTYHPQSKLNVCTESLLSQNLIFSYNAMLASQAVVQTVILGKDIIARCGISQLEHLRDEIIDLFKHTNLPKVVCLFLTQVVDHLSSLQICLVTILTFTTLKYSTELYSGIYVDL